MDGVALLSPLDGLEEAEEARSLLARFVVAPPLSPTPVSEWGFTYPPPKKALLSWLFCRPSMDL